MRIHINTLIFLLEEHDRQVMSIKYGLGLKLLGVCGKISIALSVTLRGCGPMFTTHPLIKDHPKLIYDEEGLPGDTFI